MTDRALTSTLLLQAYARGIFPMAESRNDDAVFWVDPHLRGVLPLEAFHISRRLARRIRRGDFRVTVDRAFEDVVRGCADRDTTWISDQIFRLYTELHEGGHAHSVEVWEGEELVGGVYGVAIGGAFFGESMFSRRTDASKVALAYLVSRLREGGFTLLDTQFLTDHLASLGGQEITRAEYRRALAAALERPADFMAQPPEPDVASVLQRSTHTS